MIIKNSNLRRILFENRYQILIVIIAIILILCLIQVLNNIVKQNNQQTKTNSIQSSSYEPQETVILGEDITEEQQENNTQIMDKFIQFCNAKDIENAYNLLTDECKEVLFQSNIENFNKNYIEKIFTTPKIYNMQSWINGYSDTYKVRILDDILSTGNTGNVVEEYYTIVKQNGEYKLNLNSYIGRENIGKE